MSGRVTTNRLLCPRCGYDLTGLAAAWHESCPLDGRCTECGLNFRWRDMIVSAVHPWLFEYHWRRGPIRRLAMTTGMAFRPWRFWRDVRLSDPVHLRPTLVATFAIGLATLLIAAGCETVLNTFSRSWVPTEERLQMWLRLVWRLPMMAPRYAPGVLLAIFGMPIAAMLLPTTLRRAKIRARHVVRIWLYSLIAPAVVTLAWSALLGGWDVLGTAPRWLNVEQWITWRAAYNDPMLMMWKRLMFEMVIVTLTMAWMHVWWWRACRSYLRLPHAWLTSALLVAIVWFGAMILEM